MEVPFVTQGAFTQPTISLTNNGVHVTTPDGSDGQDSSSTASTSNLSIILSIRLLMGGKVCL
jgi:hypothetical protein